ncbi:MAG: dTDP-4-dehydrorhamnose 3,5-epimerase [Candidatus Marinimicrobia bacterium]|nr:dTDP-4-dehydrorhamnose 3,5-epimerase [Candidatus Neomarinimicrobiota bacterium]|tara:strand:+ start:205 stop:750 length:546 start_codon:yes stop_codon:yes gene_type:complete
MIIKDCKIEGLKVITPKIHTDNRGSFFEIFKSTIFEENGLPYNFLQDNQVISKRGVLRGLHYQLNKPQGKFVQVIVGEILDVAVDLRLGSSTFGEYHLVELSDKNKKLFYIPEGFAHGYLVISDYSIVVYKCTNIYDINSEYGIKWNDPDIGINWDNKFPILSEKDKRLPLLKDQKFLPKF